MFESETVYYCANCCRQFLARPIGCACGASFPADGSRDCAIKVRREHHAGRISLKASLVPTDFLDDD